MLPPNSPRLCAVPHSDDRFYRSRYHFAGAGAPPTVCTEVPRDSASATLATVLAGAKRTNMLAVQFWLCQTPCRLREFWIHCRVLDTVYDTFYSCVFATFRTSWSATRAPWRRAGPRRGARRARAQRARGAPGRPRGGAPPCRRPHRGRAPSPKERRSVPVLSSRFPGALSQTVLPSSPWRTMEMHEGCTR